MNVPPSPSATVPGSSRSIDKIRELTQDQLGVGQPPLPGEIADDDERLVTVRGLLNDGYAGVIFTGPPGTSKSWYAAQIAAKLVDYEPERARFIQFHASYQYEDFVEGYVPQEDGGFVLTNKHLLDMCEVARSYRGQLCVLVIDELSRCDPGRVFGEALTYIEMTKRDREFTLASGRFVSIPDNLVFLATMNPLDRGVEEVDVALERRFAKIAMDPDPALLTKILNENGVPDELQRRIQVFFRALQQEENLLGQVGHAYFLNVRDQASLERLWTHQLRFFLERAFRLDEDRFLKLQHTWNNVIVKPAREAAGEGETSDTTGAPDTSAGSEAGSPDVTAEPRQ